MSHDSGDESFDTDSGIEVNDLYQPPTGVPEKLGKPGNFPFTRGIYSDMYRGRLWTMRQYAGFGTAEETNSRYQYLLAHGNTGLSVAFDLPTQLGYDSDHAMAEGEVGRVGVAIDSIEDMRTLFDDIALDRVSTSMTINATAAVLLALYIAVADERGVPRTALSGTVQNDILKEYIARGTYIYPPGPSLRLVSDLVRFCATEVPRWNSISVSGYHIREAGSTAPQEVAFTIANGLSYMERVLESGVPLEDFAPQVSFFFAAHNDILEEVAKFRAARRLWAGVMKDRYGASDRSCMLRFHTQTGGSTLTAQQPLNNVVRVAIQTMAAVLGGTQSLHANGYDEALAIPTEESAKLALRTQQIVAHESGVAKTVDPLAGSYYVEALTDEIENRALEYLEQIENLGGSAQALEFMQNEIHRAAYRHQMEIEGAERKVVGVNAFEEVEIQMAMSGPDYPALEDHQKIRLAEVKKQREATAVSDACEAIRVAARSNENLLPPIVRAVKVPVTLGEISDVLRKEWGTHDP